MNKIVLGMLLAAGGTAALAGTPTIDGANIPTEFPAAVATQDTNTQFGNNENELNQLFIDGDASNVYIGLTGNIADNNALTIWLDTDLASESNVLSSEPGGDCPGPAAATLVRVLDNTVLPTNFSPEYVLSISVGAFPGQATSQDLLVFASDLFNIDTATNTSLGLGIAQNGPASGALSGTSGIQIAVNNSNTLGVGDFGAGATPGDTGDDPASAVSGIEIAIPRALVGIGSGQQVRILCWITNNAQDGNPTGPCFRGGFSSNQLLPGVGGVGNLASFDPANPLNLAGTNCAGDLTGDSVVDFSDFAVLSSCFGTPCGDLTGDNLTDFADFAVLSADWGCTGSAGFNSLLVTVP